MKIQESKNEKEFISCLVNYARKVNRLNMNKSIDISYLGLVENAWTKENDYLFVKYFAVGPYYNYLKGNESMQKITKMVKDGKTLKQILSELNIVGKRN